MSWKRSNWKTTIMGVLAACAVVAEQVYPPIVPIARAVQGLALALFGFYAADGNTEIDGISQ